MAVYTVSQGDSLDRIARKYFGSAQNTALLKQANPHLQDLLVEGAEIFLPSFNQLSAIQSRVPYNNDDEVSIIINNVPFRIWQEITIDKSIDSSSVVQFEGPFEPDFQLHKDMFKPFSFNKIQTFIGGSQFFDGYLLIAVPSLTENSSTVRVTAYSKSAVLNDCTLPASMFPLEFNAQTLTQIASACCAPFGVKVKSSVAGASFKRVSAKPQDKVLSFLSSLSGQRNAVMTDNQFGDLVIQSSISSGTPVAVLEQGSSPLMNVSNNFSPQEYYSHLTGVLPNKPVVKGGKYTVKNPFLNVLRPAVFSADDAQKGDIKTATEAKMGRMFANAISYSITVSTWRDSAGNLWAPNTIIRLKAPGAMIYNHYNFLVRKVKFKNNSAGNVAELSLVLPGAFSGKIPKGLPWD